MKYSIGSIIRSERTKRGWDQAELVQRLGSSIRQQAVSGWERGTSRPTREMLHILAEIFELEEAALLREAGYVEAIILKPKEPVRPLLTTLPLSELPFDRFEQFSADLISYLNPENEVSVHRYGAQGHKQKGADIIAVKNGRKEGVYQCKRVQQFGPTAVKKAVQETSLQAEKYYLLLTRPATPAAREEVFKHQNWSLWDVEDISQLVRKMPLEKSLRLVGTYFPGGWRKQFLGVDTPGPWLITDEFFQRFSGDQIFTHSWQFVGRQETLDSISKFLTDQEQKVSVISGTGGSGKTRLIREVASIAEKKLGYEVRFLGIGRRPTVENYELLGEIPKLLVIIDDAHERIDMAEVIDSIHRSQPVAKIIIALRPYGFSQLSSDLRRIGVHPSEFPSWEIEDLKFQEAEKLAQEILGKDFNQNVARRLANLTKDCPLITVVGAGLVKRGQLDVQRLESDDSIKEILSAFRNTFVENSKHGDSDTLNALLNAVSALQPFPLNDPNFRTALEKLCGRHWDELMPYIQRLEDTGVFLRRGNSLRIVPDLLGDVILAEACFDAKSSDSTGYIERLHGDLADKALQHLIVNATRVDWQINGAKPGARSLVDFLWPTIISEFQASDYDGRLTVMKLLQKVAYFQPEQALALVRLAINQPVIKLKEVSEEPLEDLFSTDYEYVLNEIPSVLKQVAYNVDLLDQASDILWELAKKDLRRTNQHPDHPLRVLQDLASYDVWKPTFFNEKMVDIAMRWFEEEGASPHSPFDVLEELLSTEGSDTFSEGATMTFRPFAIKIRAVKQIRERVIDTAFSEAEHPDIKRAARAINAIGEGIHYPAGMFGRIVSDKERARWTRIFVDIITRLGKLAGKTNLDPSLGIKIQKSLRWHAKYSTTETKEAALDALKFIPQSLEYRLALALHSGWGDLVFEEVEDYKLRDQKRQRWYKELSEEITADRSDEAIVDLLETRLGAQQKALESDGAPGSFMWVLAETKPSIGRVICQRIIHDPRSVLVGVLPIVFSRMMESASADSLSLVPALLLTKDPVVIRSIAQALGWNRGTREDLSQAEFDLLVKLAEHPDEYVRSSVARVVHYIAAKHRDKAIELVSAIKFSDSAYVTKELFSLFGKHGVLKWEELPAEQAEIIWRQLKITPSIEDYSISEFLSDVSERDPKGVLELLKSRIEYEEAKPRGKEFRALPFDWEHQLHFQKQASFQQLLREIRDWIAENPDSWVRAMEGSKLFQGVAGEYNDPVIEVLEEAVYSGLPNQLEAVAWILREAPKDLVWNNVRFIENILEAAKKLGEERLRSVGSNLISAVESDVRSGKLGEPFQADIQQREKALKMAESLTPGSLVEKFYRTLAESAERNISWHSESSEKMQDSREW